MGNCCTSSTTSSVTDTRPNIKPIRNQFVGVFGPGADRLLDSCITPMCSPTKKMKKATLIQDVVRQIKKEDIQPPTYWDEMRMTIAGDNDPRLVHPEIVDRVPLQPDDPIFRKIQQAFVETKSEYERDTFFSVESVERIENFALFSKYATCRAKMEHLIQLGLHPPCHKKPEVHQGLMKWAECDLELHTHTVNEVLLFHGTKPHNVESILKNGFDSGRSSAGGCFGRATVYCADRVYKSAQYCSPSTEANGKVVYYMFLCRVVLGNFYQCKAGEMLQYIYRAPCLEGHRFTNDCGRDGCKRQLSTEEALNRASCAEHKEADSVIGNSPQEFMVYGEDTKVYPEFLVKFTKETFLL